MWIRAGQCNFLVAEPFFGTFLMNDLHSLTMTTKNKIGEKMHAKIN